MLEFFLAVLLMLASALLLGEALHRIGQPALVGQLLAGVLIGPSVLNLVQSTPDLATLENVALFFIMFLTGLAVRPARIVAAGKRGFMVSSVSFVVPFAGGVAVAQHFGIGLVSALTVGLTVSITAVPVNSIVLMELGLLDTELGATVIAAGVIDDVVSFIALSMIQQFGGGSAAMGTSVVAFDLGKVFVFLAAIFVAERLVRSHATGVRKWSDRLALGMKTQGSYIAFLIVSAVGVSLLAEWSGLQLVVGAFFAGFLLSEISGVDRLEKASEVVRGATLGFFGPLAFTFIGAELVLSSILGMPTFVIVLLAVAVSSKFFGGYVGARIGRFPSSSSVTIGLLMNSRGFVELVIAATAFQLGLIDSTLFSIVVGIGIVTTIVSPITARLAIGRGALGRDEMKATP